MREVPDLIMRELRQSGCDFAIEKGTRHYKIKVEGRLVGILPKDWRGVRDTYRRDLLNVRAQVRRAILKAKGEQD